MYTTKGSQSLIAIADHIGLKKIQSIDTRGREMWIDPCDSIHIL